MSPVAAGSKLAFTVDVESDWGSEERRGLETALPRLLELLESHGAPATFFVVGELAEPFRERVAPAGPHEVGSHGLTHRLLTRLDADGVQREVEQSKRRLEATGFKVRGFRAPFLRVPRGLSPVLARAGYAYDASGGSVVPTPARLWERDRAPRDGVHHLGTSTLRDGMTPFSLTWLRIYHPFGLRMLPRRPAVFFCHLHEFLDASPDASPGWPRLPRPLRRLHARNTGGAAWRIVEELLAQPRRFVTCQELVGVSGTDRHSAPRNPA